jgi:hypothetical protein
VNPVDLTSDEPNPERLKQAEVLVRMFEKRYEAFTASGEGNGLLLAVERSGANLAFPLKGSGGVRQRLAAAYRRTHASTPSTQALAEAMLVIEGQALDAPVREVHRRVGWHKDSVVLDLGDQGGAAVVVSPGSWRVVARSPLTFVRTRSLTMPLPMPEPAGDWRTGLKPLRELLNIDDVDWPLVVAWLIHGWMADQAHTLLRLQGEQGACKSTAGELLVRSIDPSTSCVRSEPASRRDWATTASGSWAFVLDNITRVETWFSDALCRAATGEAFVTRALYSDADVSVLLVQRAIIITTIGVTTTASDLAERTVQIELHRPTERLTDVEVQRRFVAAWPGIVAGLLDLTSEVLAVLPSLPSMRLPRMADFAQVLRAVGSIDNPSEPDASFDRYLEVSASVMTEVAEGSSLAEAVRRFVGAEPSKRWEGRASELIDALDAARSPGAPKAWPRTPNALSAQLARLAPALRRTGLTVKLSRSNRGSRVEIWLS